MVGGGGAPLVLSSNGFRRRSEYGLRCYLEVPDEVFMVAELSARGPARCRRSGALHGAFWGILRGRGVSMEPRRFLAGIGLTGA